jgi:hypothetical protein
VAIIKESIIEDARVKLEAKLTKTMSVRMDRENYELLREIAKEEGSDLPSPTRAERLNVSSLASSMYPRRITKVTSQDMLAQSAETNRARLLLAPLAVTLD